MIFIRFFLITASVFFICFAITHGNVFADSVILNSIFIIINLVYSYFLLIKYLPIKLNPIEQRIFDKDFSKIMDKRTFRDLIRKAHLRTFSEGGQICHDGNKFSGLFYVALVNPNFKISYSKGGIEYFTAKENVWIGVVEYMMYEKENRIADSLKKIKSQTGQGQETSNLLKNKNFHAKVKWGLDCVVSERPTTDTIKDPIYEIEDDPCYVYEFPLGELEKLFKDKNEGTLWRNALFSIWLGYITSAIVGVDQAVISKKEMRKYRVDSLVNARETEQLPINPKLNKVADDSNYLNYSNDFKRIDKLKENEMEYMDKIIIETSKSNTNFLSNGNLSKNK